MINKDLFTPLSILLSQENMLQVKRMVSQFNEIFNDDFWESVARVNQLVKGKPGVSIPVEIWEDKNHFYIVALMAGIKDRHNIKIRLKDDSNLVFRVKYSLLKPVKDCFLVQTEVSGFDEREVTLPSPVVDKDYQMDLNEGILTLTLEKQTRDGNDS